MTSEWVVHALFNGLFNELFHELLMNCEWAIY